MGYKNSLKFSILSFIILIGILSVVSAQTLNVDTSNSSAYQTIQDAVNAASPGDAINIASGTYEITSEIDINTAISLVGQGTVTIKANNPSWSISSSAKHLFDFGSTTTPVTVSNIIFDSNNQAYGMQSYKGNVIFNNIEMKNSKGAGLTVNGATVEATDLTTSGNSWGAVNVDPGVGVTTPSVFTLNSGTLNEDNQIWSDGANVGGSATVTVNADGYNEYIVASKGYHIWTSNSLTNAATITKGGTTTLYSNISDALTAAGSGDTIEVYSGTYNETLSTTKNNLVIEAASGESPIIQAPATPFSSVKRLINLGGNNITFQGFEVIGNGKADINDVNNSYLGIRVEGYGITVKDNVVHDLLTGIQTTTADAIQANTIQNNTVYNAAVGISLQNDGNIVENNNLSANAVGFGLASFNTQFANNQIQVSNGGVEVDVSGDSYKIDYLGSIQDGINAANPGDTIKVDAGNFNESLNINKEVTIFSENNENTILNGRITINSDNVNIKNLKIVPGNSGTSSSNDFGIKIYASNVSIEDSIIEGMIGSGSKTIKAVHIFEDSNTPIGNIRFINNTLRDISQEGVKGSYGIMVQAAVENVTIKNNNFENISSNGWAHAIEVTPTCGITSLVPKNVDIEGNSISSISAPSDVVGFSVDWCDNPQRFADASEVTFRNNLLDNLQIRNLDPLNALKATSNYWGTNVKSEIQNLTYGDVTYLPFYLTSALQTLSFGTTVTTNNETNETQTEIPQEVNLSADIVVGNETKTIEIAIPANVTVSSSNSSWDGTIQPPTVQSASSVNVSVPGLSNLTVAKVIEVGIPGQKLTFTKAVKITIPGEAGKKVGYSYDNGVTFTPILTVCGNNIQSWADANLAVGGDCHVDNGLDMVIWTKHFTQFVTYNASDTQGPDISNVSFSPIYPNLSSLFITVNATITDPSGVANYPELDWRILENGIQVGGDHNVPAMSSLGNDVYQTTLNIPVPKDNMSITYKITAEDGSNNSNYSSFTFQPLFTYDGSAPTTSDNVSTNWTNQDVVVNITCSDSISGCNKTYYSTDGSNPTTLYTGPFTLSATGQYQLSYYSTDNAGNVENVINGTLVRIDKDNPTVTISVPTDGSIYNYSISSLNYTASDATSPLSACWYNNGTVNSTPDATCSNFTLTPVEGSNTWTVYTNDSAGNLASSSVTFIVDTTAPVVTIAYPQNATYNTNVSQLNYNYVETNPDKCWYSTDKGVTNNSIGSCGNFTNAASVEGLNNWTVYMNDTAGNLGFAAVSFTKDTVNPLISFGSGTTEEGNYSQNYIESNVSVSDPSPGTGINRTVTYLYNATMVQNKTSLVSNFTGLADGTYYLNATTWDNAGNSNNSATRKIVLDTQAPILNITSPTNGTSTSLMSAITVTANSVDSLSGIKNVAIAVMNSSGDVVNSGNMSKGISDYEYSLDLESLATGNYTIQVNSTDYAGNMNTTAVTLSLLESLAPTQVNTVNNQVSATTGGTVSFEFSMKTRGNGTIKFGMDNIKDGNVTVLTPTQMNATISDGTVNATVGNGNFTGSQPLTMKNVTQVAPGVYQGTFTLYLTIPANKLTAGKNYPITYYIDNA